MTSSVCILVNNLVNSYKTLHTTKRKNNNKDKKNIFITFASFSLDINQYIMVMIIYVNNCRKSKLQGIM